VAFIEIIVLVALQARNSSAAMSGLRHCDVGR
jgi:hypothetical protein